MRDHPELTVGTLAKTAGVSSSAVSQWKNPRGTATMSASAAGRLAERYGYRVVWLVEGKGPRRVTPGAQTPTTEETGENRESKNGRLVPVVGVMYMTTTGVIERFSEEAGSAGGIRVQSNDPDACAIRLMGESVGIFRAGWYVLIEPAAALVPGEPVLVTLKDGKRILGELLSETGGSLSLLGLSGGTRLAFLLRDVQSVHPVSAVISPSRFVP